jgi:hypothetical protein
MTNICTPKYASTNQSVATPSGLGRRGSGCIVSKAGSNSAKVSVRACCISKKLPMPPKPWM